jgi:hypothetical protein
MLADYLKTDRSSVVRNVHSAVGQGYLVNLSPGKGREAKLQLGERTLSSGEVLPHPDTLFADASPTTRDLQEWMDTSRSSLNERFAVQHAKRVVGW